MIDLINSLAPKFIKNRTKLISGYLGKKPVTEGFPLELAIEITNHCNVDCVMCPRNKMERPKGYMDISLFKEIVNQAKGKTEFMFLHLAGEPLLHPDLPEMISLSRRAGIKTAFSTNAVLLNEKMSRKVLENPPDLLVLSLDGTSKETYESIRRRTNFENVVSNINGFLRLKPKRRAPYTIIQLIYMKENAPEAEKFLSEWKKTRVNAVRIKPFFNYPGLDKNLSAIAGSSAKPEKPCILIWRQLAVYWDGTVVVCCQDFLGQSVLGNLKKTPLQEIWNGEKMRQMRLTHLRGERDKINLCRSCTMPKASPAVLLASIFVDDLSIKKILPKIEEWAILKNIRQTNYFS